MQRGGNSAPAFLFKNTIIRLTQQDYYGFMKNPIEPIGRNSGRLRRYFIAKKIRAAALPPAANTRIDIFPASEGSGAAA
jgi:hypothetical protein